MISYPPRWTIIPTCSEGDNGILSSSGVFLAESCCSLEENI